MRVLGLDLSLTSTGVALPDGTVDRLAPPRLAGVERLQWIRSNVLARCVEQGQNAGDTVVVDLVAIEGFSYGSKGSSIDQVYGNGWIVRLSLWEWAVPYVEISPAQVKIYATGTGTAGKDEVLAAAIRRLGYTGHSNDEADALWLRAITLDAYGEPVVDVPQTHRRALDKVRWPTLAGFAPVAA